MIPLADPPSRTVVVTHTGRGARGLRAGFALFTLMVALTSCTPSIDHDDESTLAGDLEPRVNEFLERYDEYDKVRAVLVYEHGAPVLELHRGEDAEGYLNLRSVTKSVVATLIGIAIDEGLIPGVDATLGELLPSYREAMNAEVAAIPLERVLTHTAGFVFGASGPGGGDLDFSTTPDWVAAIIADRVARGPGDGSFHYSNAGAHLLAGILDEATDGAVLEFARAQLFDPLGIDSEPAWVEVDEGTPEERLALAEQYLAADFAWPTDPQGVPEGQSLLKLRPQDMANLGLLYLEQGVWEGEEVVSAEWVEAATTEQVKTSRTPNGYGYQWWTHTDESGSMSVAQGYGGNVIVVVPDRDIVAVVASTYDGIEAIEEVQKFDESEALTLVQYVVLAPRE